MMYRLSINAQQLNCHDTSLKFILNIFWKFVLLFDWNGHINSINLQGEISTEKRKIGILTEICGPENGSLNLPNSL